MSKIVFLINLLFITTMSYSQSNVQISGQVRDKITNNKLSYCSVVLMTDTDSIITGAVTNDNGFFYIPTKDGNYKIEITFVGYTKLIKDIGSITSDKFVGDFYLTPDSKMMDGVTVKSNSRENSIDKDIQIVTEEMRIGATDTKDLLAKVSGVSYDRYKNSIKVDNSSNIVILADGVEKDVDYIQNLSPARIKRIEIIRDPGGRYGLEGYTAIVNVILNKNYVGTEVYIFDQLLADVTPLDIEYSLPINRFKASYNYTYNKINIYAAVNISTNNLGLQSNTTTAYDNDSIVYENPRSNADPNLIINNNRMNYTIGADYYINPKHTISFESNIHNFPKSHEMIKQDFIISEVDKGTEINNYNFFSTTKGKTLKSNHSLFYTGKLNNKDRIEASFTYYNYNEEYDNGYEKETPSLTRLETGINKSNTTKLNIEYSREFNSKLNTQIGYGNYWKEQDNEFVVTGSSSSNNSYYQKNTRHKFYAYASYKFNNKFSAKIGGAGEASRVLDKNQDNNYLIFQPLVDFRYMINDKLTFKLKYRSSSYYPTIDETNPFERLINARTVSVGNPNLQPSVTHKLSLRTEVMQGFISIEPYYHFSNNYIGQVGRLRSDGIFEYTYDNLGLFEEAGVKANFTIPFGKSLFWQNSITLFSSKITNNGIENSVKDWRASSNLIYSGFKNEGVIVLNFDRNMSKDITSLGYTKEDNDYWLLLYQQPFFKKRLTLLVGYFLPIDFGADYIQDTYVRTPEYEQHNNIDTSLLKNMIIVKATFRLSNGKIKKTEKDLELEDEGGSGGLL